MLLHRRRKGSQRPHRPRTVKFQPNWGGQGGSDLLVLETGDEWWTLEFETEAEVKQLLSQAHIIHLNYGDKR